ncbi:MAG: PIN domain-containing protein [Chloroflexota bacterium]
MVVLLDTSFLIEVERGRRTMSESDDVAIAAITASELIHGVMQATPAHRARREAFVEHILGSLPIIGFTLPVARTYARIWVDAVRAGRSPGAHDLMVAATALTLDYPLRTLNRRDFARIPGLQLWNED